MMRVMKKILSDKSHLITFPNPRDARRAATRQSSRGTSSICAVPGVITRVARSAFGVRCLSHPLRFDPGSRIRIRIDLAGARACLRRRLEPRPPDALEGSPPVPCVREELRPPLLTPRLRDGVAPPSRARPPCTGPPLRQTGAASVSAPPPLPRRAPRPDVAAARRLRDLQIVRGLASFASARSARRNAVSKSAQSSRSSASRHAFHQTPRARAVAAPRA